MIRRILVSRAAFSVTVLCTITCTQRLEDALQSQPYKTSQKMWGGGWLGYPEVGGLKELSTLPGETTTFCERSQSQAG
ncbi:hypothetical protein DAEQUDRAFT_721615 [Daedalea quercina L-15889]|uniref:Uncharacterized protein n=1 Tax=Daedalea quercina L-15889 TaxID=1314783 RepID=A0A165TK02_9APHY|nr:hypothetical protein DAEQUDRAFT_721615 [Daedalea quercina L-15889]